MFSFDPFGPERLARDAKAAFEGQEPERAVRLYVRAVGSLHDLYVLDSFRARQPSASDAVVIEGLVAAVEVLRSRDPDADVAALVDSSVGQLAEMAGAAERAGWDGGAFVRAAARLAGL